MVRVLSIRHEKTHLLTLPVNHIFTPKFQIHSTSGYGSSKVHYKHSGNQSTLL